MHSSELEKHHSQRDAGQRNVHEKTIETSMPHPSHAYFLLFREEGLPSTFFTRGRLTIFRDSAIASTLDVVKCRAQLVR